MDFEFTKEEIMFRDSVKAFLDKEYAPVANERDKKGPFTKDEAIDILKKFKKIGVAFDPESAKELYAEDPMLYGILSEEVGKVWVSLLPVIGMTGLPALFVPLASEETQNRLMPKLEKAELIGCFAETEPEAGCDTSDLKTTARLENDHYTINGAKTWISNATIADVAYVGAKDLSTGLETFFLIEKDISPFDTNELHKIGWNAAPTGEMFFEDCRVTKENEMNIMMGKAFSDPEIMKRLPMSEGMMRLFGQMSPFTALMTLPRCSMGLASLGIAQAAFEASVKYSKERVQFGKPLGKFQLIQEMLYQMNVLIETGRLLAYKAIDAISKGSGEARRLSSMAKIYGGEAAVKVTYNAVQIHGGLGLSDELPLERYYRDARMMTIPDGTSEMMKLITGYTILGKGFSAYT
ncbi:MAG: acyl-CoA/acyl-ACP dehydrogenase [Candidatus Bathyarchaeota archaeon]|nr:MAG: acyl-CoA/acyl-ACP dehydrogenase [Candidatus Bathyarchaeota archaeon]